MYKQVGVLAAFSAKGQMQPAYVDLEESGLCKVVELVRSEKELDALNRMQLYTCNVQTAAGVEQIRIRYVSGRQQWIMLDRVALS